MQKLKVFIVTDKTEGSVQVVGQSQKESTIEKVTEQFRQQAFKDAKENGGGVIQGNDYFATTGKCWDIVDKDDLKA